MSGKARAVRRVTENQGKNTPGVDQVLWDRPQKKRKARSALRQRDDHPKPRRRICRPKKNGKKRPPGLPCRTGRALQALDLLALDPVSETTADHHSYGCRPGRSPAEASEACVGVLRQRTSPPGVLEGDSTGCVDALSQEWLRTPSPREKTRRKKGLNAGDREQLRLHPTEEGTPQGGIMSPVLAKRAGDGRETLL